MSAKSEKILRDFTQALTKPKGTTPYDTTAKVLRVENGIAWVHIAGGVDETPVKMTIDAKAGDTVQVRVSGGRAFLVGNATAPPTDDATANVANKRAVNADKKAGVAKQTAEEAQETADVADGKATEAKEIAEEAGEAVERVAQHFWTDEDGAHITEVTQEEYIDDPENAGGNALIDSIGIQFRKGLEIMAHFFNAGLSFKSRGGQETFSIDTSATPEQSNVVIRKRILVPYGEQTTFVAKRLALAEVGAVITFRLSTVDSTSTPAQYIFTKGTPDDTQSVYNISVDYDGDCTFVIDNQSVSNSDYQTGWTAYEKTWYKAVETLRGDALIDGDATIYDDLVVDGGLTIGEQVTWESPDKVFAVVTYNHTYSNVSSGNNMDWTEGITKKGYYPIGVMGVYLARAALCITQCRIYDRAIGSCTLRVNARAVAAVSGTTCSAQVLWVKAE